MILNLCISVFITQLIFIGFRTWNVRAVASGDMRKVIISGTIVHLSWMVGIAIGATSVNQIISHMEWQYLPVVISSLVGSLLGSYYGMKERKGSKKNAQ